MEKKLYRVQEGKILAGVCTGIAKYFKLDPVIVRIIWVLLGCCTVGILAYIACAFIIPEEPTNVIEG